MSDGCLLIGAGDGTVDVLDEINWKGEFPKGTRNSEIYAIDMVTFLPLLCVTCHRCAINDIAFPR
ncbi:hypothetical protein MSG28_004378 [Choristoneura fumiferana]|uniref:Uncharacterized protein n=1 Tax=Choristoneura fumiferana TaxID=7141 RepID=A0ACC0KJ14_CHOFU|nr:hypothetical protein MSG28_004378 [Choristoneura fumiferana]